MSENDYIAEYIKERFPNLLGADYGWWKVKRVAYESMKTIGAIFSNFGDEMIREESETQENEEDI